MAQRNMDDFHNFMNQLMQILVQRKMEKGRADLWLNKSLTEYGAYEDTQKRLMVEALLKDAFEKQFGSIADWSKDQPFSPYTANKLMRSLLPEELQGRIPELQMPGSAEAAQGSMVDLMGAFKAGEFPSDESIKGVLPAYGHKEALDMLKETKRGKEEGARLDIRKLELDVDKKRIEQEWSNLNHKIKELKRAEEKDKEKTSDDVVNSYKTLAGLYDKQIEVLQDALNTPEGMTEEGAAVIQKKIDVVVKNKERLIKKVEDAVDLDTEEEGGEGLSKEEAKALYISTLVSEGVPQDVAEQMAQKRFGANG